MFHTPESNHYISMKLSEVLDDIGVNETMIMKWRRTMLLSENMETATIKAEGRGESIYYLGSLSEGTTTQGLHSDTDALYYTLIQDWCEWTPGRTNFMIIQEETTPPGYCLLQELRSDIPLPLTVENGNHLVKDTNGRILFKNTILGDILTEHRQRQGPSLTSPAQPGITAADHVIAFPFKSWPLSARVWIDQQETNTWLTERMKRHMKTTRCFVVGVGNKVSESADFEWRVSTSLAERCLMFSLNITQIRCYILMKMILKTYINTDNESYISSYICKTILFHCIASKPLYIWCECNILNCLNFCILTLRRCILSGNCPHFIISENNLMAGRFSTQDKQHLLATVSNLIPCDVTSLSGIQIDDLGERLQIKLSMINLVNHNIPQAYEYTLAITCTLSFEIAKPISVNHSVIINMIKDQSLVTKLKTLLQIVLDFTKFYREGDMFAKTASRLLVLPFCTSIGSLIASHNIQINRTVSPQAMDWLEVGQDSDVASGRLKLASTIYCAGDMERAANILYNLEEQYNIEVAEPVCGCYNFPTPDWKRGFGQIVSQLNVMAITNFVAFCVSFSQSEINCVPQELQYEMFRSTPEDLLHRDEEDNEWMDFAVVDSLPYLYFLQYKTYGNLQRIEEQQQALNNLMWVTAIENNLGHRETALNLLGQCMEQENRPIDALQCYRLSLHLRERNNAARIHVCRCLANTISRLGH